MVDAGSADGKHPNERAMSGSRREKPTFFCRAGPSNPNSGRHGASRPARINPPHPSSCIGTPTSCKRTINGPLYGHTQASA